MKIRSIVFGLAGVLLVLAAVVFVESASAATSNTITISEVEFALNPNTFTVTAGQPIQFTVTNNGKVQHNVKVELPSANIEQTLFDSNLQPGETRTATYTFSQAGDWEIYCPVGQHEQAGMKGTVTVLAASTSQAAATSTSTTGASAGSTPASPSTLPTTGGEPGGVTLIVVGIVLTGLAGFALWRLASVPHQ